jgi:hypothetical protein
VGLRKSAAKIAATGGHPQHLASIKHHLRTNTWSSIILTTKRLRVKANNISKTALGQIFVIFIVYQDEICCSARNNLLLPRNTV